MDQIIKSLETKSFSGDDILKVADNKTKILTYRQLKNFDNIDEVLSPHDNVTLLVETYPNYGHWISIIKHKPKNKKEYIEIFDPYGMQIDSQRDWVKKSFRSPPYLSKLLLNSKYPLINNRYPFQEFADDVSSCGRHVAFRIQMKNYPLNQYIKIMTKSKYNPDMLVTYLTAFQ